MDRLELLLQADELADLLLMSPEIEVYRRTEEALNRNGNALNLLKRFHELREQVAEFQARKVPPMHYSYLLAETDQLLKQLEEIPEVTAYEQAQAKLNELLDAVTATLYSAVQERKTGLE